MSLFGNFDFNPHLPAEYGRQVNSFSRDAGHLADLLRSFAGSTRRDLGNYADHTRRDLGRYANHAGHDIADAAWRGGRVAAKIMGKQAFRAGKAVRRDPMPAVMAVAGLACLLNLAMTKPRKR